MTKAAGGESSALTGTRAPDLPPQQRIEEKPSSQQQDSNLEQDSDPVQPAAGLSAPQAAAPTSDDSPDYTLAISAQATQPKHAEPAKPTSSANSDSQSKRVPLPYTFNFGVRRPQALAVAMNRPQLGNQTPETPNQAIQQTFDLAATNAWPYALGSKVNLVA